MTTWMIGTAVALASLIAAWRLRRSGEPRAARYVSAFAVGALVVLAPIAIAGETRYRLCVADYERLSHCNWLRANPWGTVDAGRSYRALDGKVRVKPIRVKIKRVKIKPIHVKRP